MHDHSISEIWANAELLKQTRAGVELWRPVLNSDGWYDVSNFGRVRTWIKRGGRYFERTRLAEPKVLVATPNSTKFPYLCVTIFVNGRRYFAPVHRLVCEAFIGPRPGSIREWDAGHDDDDQANNRLDNLKWCTRKANARDQVKNGRRKAKSVI